MVAVPVVTALVWHEPGGPQINSPMSFALSVFVVPTVICFVVCRLPILRDHPILVAVCAPFCFVFGVLAGLSLGVNLGFMEP